MPPTTKVLPHIYLFHGPDMFSIAEKIVAWKTRFAEKYGAGGSVVFDCEEMGSGSISRSECVPDPISFLKNALSSHTLFSTTSLVIIKQVFSKDAGPVHEVLCALLPTLPHTTFVVLTAGKRDATSELSKLLTQRVKKGVCSIESFAIPAGPVLKKWISDRARLHGGSFEPPALAVFTRALEQSGYSDENTQPISLWQLDHEIRKLVSYTAGKPVRAADIQMMSLLPISAHIFDLSDALVAGNQKEALLHAHRLDPLMRTLQFLMTQFRGFLILKSMEEDGKPDAEIARILAWNPKRIWVVKKKIAHHTTASLKAAYASLLDLESQLKTGSVEPSLALDLFITHKNKTTEFAQ